MEFIGIKGDFLLLSLTFIVVMYLLFSDEVSRRKK